MSENKEHIKHSTEEHKEHVKEEHVAHKEEKTEENKDAYEHKPEHNVKKIKKSAIWQIISGILVIALILSIFTGGFGVSFMGKKAAPVKQIAPSDASQKTIDYINKNLLPAGSTAKISSIAEDTIHPELYKIKLNVQGKDFDSYITKDGGLLFPSAIDMTVAVPQTPAQPQQTAQNYSELARVANPQMTVWIVSRCPFGIQATNGLTYVKNLLGDKANIQIRYMETKDSTGALSSMHGVDEHKENERQVCLREEQPTKYWAYLKCYVETGTGTTCEKTAGVDSAKLAACATTKADTYLSKDADDWANIYVPKGGSGSPSFFLNDEKLNEFAFSQNGRSPENLKQILCNSMTTPAKECATPLPTASPPAGFGTLQGGATTGATQASCG